MKTRNVKLLLSAAVVLLMAWAFASCSKSDDATPTPLVTTKLNDSIAVASALVASTTEGVQDGEYTVGSQATLGVAIAAATAVSANPASTQVQIDAATISLGSAIATYRNGKVVPVAADALVGHWSFDEGTGTKVADATANHFDGTFVASVARWGAKVPVWTNDRKGEAGKALQFNNGASIEVPYNTKLNPTTLSVAVWVKNDTIYSGNRFLGLQSWLGYKFQLQEDNRPFATVQTATADYDRNAGIAIPVSEWHHLVFTFTDGHMYFYIDGQPTPLKNDDTPGTASSISATPYNLVFGADFPAGKYSTGDGTDFNTVGSPDYHVIPLAWGGHFIGALDEFRIYNIALTDSQVLSIYNREK